MELRKQTTGRNDDDDKIQLLHRSLMLYALSTLAFWCWWIAGDFGIVGPTASQLRVPIMMVHGAWWVAILGIASDILPSHAIILWTGGALPLLLRIVYDMNLSGLTTM